ncbi:tyrosine-type recombinase/integrase [Actinomadura rubrisoli]|uniref:Tyrosine-type recombinase/integrase n=1 Tax=Actinomadura rubrisoli TaxID=2530368 RepID=A0A4R5CIJ3_9ACTN|nr:hypothetical protein [Actinomadura rubrisoli]TDD97154.1 hypothetical protein E1298_01585 [Actinomadura rubrisoli]
MPMVGTISSYETNDGPRWRFRGPMREDPITGRKGRHTVNGLLSYEEAYQAEIQYNAKIGLLTVDTAATLEEVIQLRMAETSIAHNTVASYMAKIRRLPEWLMKKPLAEIDKGHIETMLKDIMERRIKHGAEPYKLSYMNNLLSLVSGTFEYAMQKRVPVGNPCTQVSPKKVLAQYFKTEGEDWKSQRRERGPASANSWEQRSIDKAVGQGPVMSKDNLLRVQEDFSYPYQGYLLTTFLQATRRGESLGLTWDRTDLEDGYDVALIQDTITVSSGKIHITPVPKNGQARETLLDPLTVEVLEIQRDLQNKIKEEYPNWKDGWVFTALYHPNAKGWYPGKYIRPDSLLSTFQEWARRRRVANDGIRVLRRTWANIAANVLGIPPYVIMRVLGHTGETVTTEHYTTATDEQVRDAIAAVRDHVFGPL